MADVSKFSPDGGTTEYNLKDADARSRLTTLESAMTGKQDTLTFDNAPTANSNNPVKSGGVYTAVGVWTSAVSCVVGDTTATISNASIHTTSSIRIYAQTSSGAVVGYTSIAVTEGQAVVTFAAALEEAASIKLQIFN